MSGILVVIDRELDEEQIDGAMRKGVSLQAEGSRGRAGGGYARIDKLELGLGESFLEPFCNHRAISVHLGDGTSHEGYARRFVLFEDREGMGKGTAGGQVFGLKGRKSRGGRKCDQSRKGEIDFHEGRLLREKASMASPVIFAKSLFSIEFTGVSQDPPTVRTASS